MLASTMRGSLIDQSTSRSRAIRSGSPTPSPAAAMRRWNGMPAAPMVEELQYCIVRWW